ncbi:MAG TPA: MarR family transcriptional regulator [Gaiellaceae bacterium]|jgi:DNA-binding MarR family transcriptional regulator
MAGSADHLDEILEQWRRERPDLDSRDLDALGLFGRLFRAAKLADAALGEGLGEHKLQNGWFDLLAAVRRAGAPYELNPTDLMRATMLSSGGMTKRLDRLAAAGLIKRRPDPGDRRGTLVRLTPKGKTVIDKALVSHLANERRLLGSLSAAERRSLDALLRSLLAALEAPMSGDTGTDRRSGRGSPRPAPGHSPL